MLLYSHNPHSKGARLLTRELGIRRIRLTPLEMEEAYDDWFRDAMLNVTFASFEHRVVILEETKWTKNIKEL